MKYNDVQMEEGLTWFSFPVLAALPPGLDRAFSGFKFAPLRRHLGPVLAGLSPADVCQNTTDLVKVSGLPRHSLRPCWVSSLRPPGAAGSVTPCLPRYFSAAPSLPCMWLMGYGCSSIMYGLPTFQQQQGLVSQPVPRCWGLHAVVHLAGPEICWPLPPCPFGKASNE